jgi:hypothetical protein
MSELEPWGYEFDVEIAGPEPNIGGGQVYRLYAERGTLIPVADGRL